MVQKKGGKPGGGGGAKKASPATTNGDDSFIVFSNSDKEPKPKKPPPTAGPSGQDGVDPLGEAPKRPDVKKIIGGASWTGKLPVNLLSEHCQKQKWERPEYTMVTFSSMLRKTY
jgi:ATP-dependent RNA helicase DHX57